mmetsp:Transcript_79875/g.183018  ORF Transcript_79875/g.183018 Transcript_79875/m.183018 type:complete len:252 (+) Transcript_79875:5899-6654(+)
MGQDWIVDTRDHVGCRSECRQDGVVPLQPHIDHKGPSLRIHTRYKLDIHKILSLRQALAIIYHPVGQNLAQQHDRLLSEIQIHVGHVQIVNKIHQLLGRRRAVGPASSLVQKALHDLLQLLGCGVTIQVDTRTQHVLTQLGEVVLHHCGLPGPRHADEQDGLASLHVQIDNVLEAFVFHVGHDDVLIHALGEGLVGNHEIRPWDPLLVHGVEPEVKAFAVIRELHLRSRLHPPTVGLLVVTQLVVCAGTTR